MPPMPKRRAKDFHFVSPRASRSAIPGQWSPISQIPSAHAVESWITRHSLPARKVKRSARVSAIRAAPTWARGSDRSGEKESFTSSKSGT